MGSRLAQHVYSSFFPANDFRLLVLLWARLNLYLVLPPKAVRSSPIPVNLLENVTVIKEEEKKQLWQAAMGTLRVGGKYTTAIEMHLSRGIGEPVFVITIAIVATVYTPSSSSTTTHIAFPVTTHLRPSNETTLIISPKPGRIPMP